MSRSPGPTVAGLNDRRTSLSLKATLVRGFWLVNGYPSTHGATTAAFASAMQTPPLPVTVTVLSVVAATNCVVDSVADCPGSIEAIGLPGISPSGSSTTCTVCTVVVPVLVIVYVYSTSPPPAGRSVLQSPPVVPPQVSVPSFGSFRPTRVQSGDGGPLVPVGLSGLDESRHIGSQSARFVSGVALHEQLVWRTSETPLMVTVVLEPRLDFPCAVASMLKPFSLALVRTSPGLRLGRLYVADVPDDPVMVTVVAPLIGCPVYFSVSAIAPPVQPALGGGAAAAHAVFLTSSEQQRTT